MASLKATECRKFSPNIFNKTKCQNCFRGKESHSVEALESNRATRKVSCCGYLFVAPPDWDFSLAANRNKRWQRRWFVLFDDGELAYSVDEHPETVPQRVIDMNRVLEVADAEGVTGSPFSLALCADEIHFVRGATKEEARKWFEVLSKFPRNTVCGKYKRNATFPCLKSAPVVKMEMPSRRDTVDGFSTKQVSIFDLGDDLYPTRDTNVTEKKKQELVQNERSSEVSKILMSEDVKIDSFKSSFEKKTPCISSLQKCGSGDLKGRTDDLKPSVEKSQSKTNLSQVRGDPDGCNLDCLSPVACCKPVAEFVADQDESFLKKGWLVKQEEQGGGWNKHWFVLRNSGLAFYADPIAEEAGVLDGVVDLRQVHDVAPEVDSSRGFTFCVLMKDSSRLFLSAVTSKIRSQWVMAIVSAASPPTLPPSPPLARTAISRVKERARSRSTRRCFPLKEKEVKDRLEDASWAIWLDVAKFCREVEARLGQLGEGAAGCLARVEERLHAVQEELEKAKGVLGISDHLATPPNCMLRHACEGERRRLQAEVRAAQSAADGLELQCLSLRQAHEQAERLHGSQLQLMAARVEDLTGKLLASERQVRQLRQRVAKLETRRRSSLKGKEALTLSKEYEAKLSELEGKIAALLGAEEEAVEGSVLARLHTLDRKVKEAPAVVATAAATPAPAAIAMPKIRLQVNESESDAENWNTLSLSASMTDLSTPSLTPGECLDELGHKVASLVAWLRTSLPSDVQLGTQQQQQLELFRDLQLLMEASAALHCRTDCHQYRSSVLIRVERALKELEQYMEQTGTISLCAIAGRFLYDPPQVESNEHREEEEALAARVQARRARASAALSEFKARFVERLCAVLLELGEEEEAEPHSGKPLGQKQFLAHIGHIVTQVSQTFATHLASSFFPCSSEAPLAQVQRELAQLSTEIQSLCSQHLSPSFFSTSAKCGVLVEYVRCAVSELARLASLSSLVTICATDSCLPPYRIDFVSLCDPNELGMSHRSVSSLLCFKRKWKDMQCRSCTELRQEVSYLQGELEESRAGALCEKCNALKEQLEGLMVQQELQLNEEKKQMEKELQTTKNNLKKIEHHYDGEIKKLQHEYESKLQQKNELLREDIKLRYSDEMEQLKCLCERGLSALDLAHQKIMSELEKRHQRELQELVLHQEKALADEAHATALALEAMRRTHSEELKKQVQSFKDEFVLNVNKKLETEAFRKCYESDLTKMKCEILSMAEKYSFKCLENSTLHEKLEIVNQQLKSTTTQVVELLAKNRQLQAHLTSASIQEDSIFSNL